MKFNSLFLSFFTAITLVSCGGEKEGGEASGSAPSVGKSSLAAYDSKFSDLLKRDRLDKVFGTSGVEAKMSETNVGGIRILEWSWPSDGRVRKMTIAGNTLEVPQDNQASVSGFKVLTSAKTGPKDGKSYVEANYRSVSPEEMAAMQESMKEALRKRLEKGEITEEQAKLAGGLGEGLAGKERVVEAVDGLGDAARWVAADRTLAVGHGDVFFSLYVDVSADNSLNKEKAVALAKEILASAN